jgi:hypothetical protein
VKCEGRAQVQVVGPVPVCIPRETVVGAVKRKTELTVGIEGVGGEVVGKVMEARPSREGWVGAPRAHDVKGQFGVRKKAVPEVGREVGVGGSEGGDEVVFAVLTDFSAGVDL